MQMYAIYKVGSQGILIDTGTRTDIDSAKRMIENLDYSFEKDVEYVCLPYFLGGRKQS